MTVAIRPAVPADAATIHGFVTEPAAYERLSHAVRSTPGDLAEALFCRQPRVFCDIAERDGRPAGMALWFYDFSTFTGRHGLYLEDLYVRPEHRRHGLGRALLARLARRCRDEGLTRLQWSVLDWNAPAIAFYRGLGAALQDEWTGCRLDGAALARLGEEPA
ncbi:GNAT family N-acetyltransferase [Lichenibacterium ramalinae]|uniref:GNAT family N-acetyltransferase n=1 Tax=Lichenibacterium ramalinae TaxID=2316527 RepID=A0A4V1RJ63_9HYPH|nr:GNAT family N-acetyltransferase [Lichenibacterium ramalinae]RYB07218.1 GNAT family N-acetyltransferase [Lichenibacterium ramalinae]